MGDPNLLNEVRNMIRTGAQGQIFSAIIVATGPGNTVRIQHPGSTSADPKTYTIIGGVAPAVGSQVVVLQNGSGLIVLNHTGHPIVDVGSPSWYTALAGDLNLAAGYGWEPAAINLNTSGPQTINNDGTEVELASQALPIGTLLPTAPARGIRIDLGGTYLNNSAATRTLRMRVKVNGASIWDSTTAALAASAVTTAWAMSVIMVCVNGTNVQQMFGWFGMASQTAPAVGQGDLATAPLIPMRPIAGNAAIDVTVNALTLSITMQHSIANASLTLTKGFSSIYTI